MRLIDADALDDVVQDLNENKNYGITRGEYKLIDSVLFEFPTIEERKTGKWIDYTDEGYVECPFCHSATNCEGDKDELHYCFSCGARMESAK